MHSRFWSDRYEVNWFLVRLYPAVARHASAKRMDMQQERGASRAPKEDALQQYSLFPSRKGRQLCSRGCWERREEQSEKVVLEAAAAHEVGGCLALDLSISRAGSSSGRVRAGSKKIRVFRAEKILPMTVPWDVSGLSFRVGLGPGPSLGGPPAHFIV
jgi:hypothetical protein